MRKLTLLCSFLITTNIVGYCQDALKIDSILSKLKLIEGWIKEEESEKVGTFVVYNFKVKTKNLKRSTIFYPLVDWLGKVGNSNEDSVHINKIKMTIRDGAILDMQVFTDRNKTFTNYSAPLDLNQFTEENTELTYLNTDNQIEAISTKDFIRWERESGYYPNDISFELNTKNSTKELFKGVGINQIIDFRLFTDLSAAFSGKPNGLAQAQASYKVVTRAKALKSRFFRKYGIIPFRFFSGSAIFSKFDSRFGKTTLDSSFTRQKLLQRSAFNFDATINIFSRWISRKSNSWFYLNSGLGFNSSILATNKDTSNVAMPYWFIDPYFELKVSQNVGVDLSFRIARQSAPQLDDSQNSWRYILRPQMTLYWSSANSPANRLFGRVTYFSDLREPNNPFYQVQLGYSALISQFIKGSSNKSK